MSASCVGKEVMDRIPGNWLSVIVFAILAVAVCGVLAAGEELYVLVDGFDDITSGWESIVDERASVDYVDGEYEMQLHRRFWAKETWAPLDKPLEHVQVELSAYKQSGSDRAEYGLVLGMGTDTAYYVGLTADGRFSIRHIDAAIEQASPAAWADSPAIHQGEGSNSILLTIQGRRAAFAVNGEELAAVELPTSGPYEIGLYASSHSPSPVAVRFTEITIEELPAPVTPTSYGYDFETRQAAG